MKKKQSREEMITELTKLIQIIDKDSLEALMPLVRNLAYGSSRKDELMDRLEKTGFICR